MFARLCLSLLFLGAGVGATAAPPAEDYDLPQVVAVQNRASYLNHDLTVTAGALPSDAFNKGWLVGSSYTYFFSDYLAWEVINFNVSLNSETNLKNDLLDLGVEVENTGFDGALDFITYFATTNLVYTPIYNKNLLFNKKVINGETSFVAGAGAANFDSNGPRPLVSLGLYLRFFTKETRSWKFDFRNNIYFEDKLGAVNAWSFSVGYSMQLGSRPVRP